MARSRFGEVCYCCCLPALPGPALISFADHFVHLCSDLIYHLIKQSIMKLTFKKEVEHLKLSWGTPEAKICDACRNSARMRATSDSHERERERAHFSV